ncbi:MAG: hypothetical protein R2864_09200 [Syntrophotaleaceae bacterium]
MRFYERYGARPISGTAYETPVKEGRTTPYLVFDDLGQGRQLGADRAKSIVRAILERNTVTSARRPTSTWWSTPLRTIR